METTHRVLVAIVTYNSAAHLAGLLDSLPSALGGVSAHITVVDNGSTDGTLAILDARSDVTTVRSTNIGYAGAINKAIASAPRTETVLICNPDLRLQPGSVPAMLAALDHPRVGVVAPRVLDANGRLVHSLRRDPSLLRALGLGRSSSPLLAERVNDDSAYDHPHTVDWALGAVLLIDRSCYDEVGGWDDSYFLYSEETDYCMRIRGLGWKVAYTPEATALHDEGGSGRSAYTHTMQVLNKVRLFSRHHGPVKSAAYYLITIVSQLSWIARGRTASRTAVLALLRPSSRPAPLGLNDVLIPR